MKLHIVVIRDIKANVLHSLSSLRTSADSSAHSRMNAREIPKKYLAKHPEDFEVYELGWYGDGDAYFELLKHQNRSQ